MKNSYIHHLAAMTAILTIFSANAQASGGNSSGGNAPDGMGSNEHTIVNNDSSNTGMSSSRMSNGMSGNVNGYSNTTDANSYGALSSSSGSNAANWNEENSYWQKNYSSRPYYSKSRNYSTYAPAYQYGVDLYNRNPGVPYSSLNQSQLSSGWNDTRNNSKLDWSDAQLATRDAYNRLYENGNYASRSVQ